MGYQAKELLPKSLSGLRKVKKKVNYKLRDWLFAWQRYWGVPIPVILLDETGETIPLPNNKQPVTLPELDDFTPTGSGESPLAKAVYYLRFMDPKNSNELVDKKKQNYWSPVDVYVSGAEHAVLHLLYSRFWHKVLCQLRSPSSALLTWGLFLVKFNTLHSKTSMEIFSADSDDTDSPNIRLIAWAYKMSKNRGNIINPDDVITEYGADSLHLYEMFMGPFSCIEEVHRFLARTWRLIVTEEIEGTHFNTGISATMEFINAAYKWDKVPRLVIEAFVLLLSPYAPHMAEELWSRLGHSDSLAYEHFPETRGSIQVEEACTEEDAVKLASLDEKLSKILDGKNIKKRIYVRGKILNIILEAQKVKVGHR
ncbi:Methionyl/Valyl/Leucyl/Isoleucyl-tRNA synthetase, anticodon-binding [Dillenia turbinata]|uniref:leucine--tRNA ligase n=1 Tax=Dillenia turbinata TaxID=194707 RepID=A0AAN8YYN2_9MAGN